MSKKIKSTIGFDYIKSNYHREIYAEGVHGGFTPRGKVQMSFYNERAAIPTHTEHEIERNEKLGKEILEKREARDSVIRTVEATIILDINTAKSIIQWLQEKVIIMDKQKRKKED